MKSIAMVLLVYSVILCAAGWPRDLLAQRHEHAPAVGAAGDDRPAPTEADETREDREGDEPRKEEAPGDRKPDRTTGEETAPPPDGQKPGDESGTKETTPAEKKDDETAKREAEAPKMKRATFSLGLSLYGAAWDPVWGERDMLGDMLFYPVLNSSALKIEKPVRELDVKPSVLAGLHFTADFLKQWGIAANVMLGSYNRVRDTQVAITTKPDSPFEYNKLKMENIKFDSDILVTYRLSRWLKIYGGPKYQGYTFKEKYQVNGIFLRSQKENLGSLGIGVGVALTLRLVENLYFVPNLSFMSLYGTATGQLWFARRDHAVSVGGNAMVPLAYYIERIRTTVSLGFRYQFLYYTQVSNSDYLNRWDHFYGALLSVIYSF